VISTSAAYADNVQPDGDTATGGNNLLFQDPAGGQTACSMRGSAIDGQLVVTYNGSSHFTPTEAVNVTLTSPDAGIVVTSTATSVPATWNATGQSFDIPISTTTSTSVSHGTHTVGVHLVGATSNYSPNDKSFDVTVGTSCPVTASNRPPTVDAGGPYTGNEGTDVSIAGTANDPDLDPLTYAWTYAIDSADTGTTCAFADATSLTTTVSCTDDGSFTLTLTATGDPAGPVADTATLTLDNVAPASTSGSESFSYDHVSGKATASFDFTDAGTNDTHTSSFTWSAGTPAAPDVTETGGAGTASDTATLAPGCYTVSVTGTVTDDNGSVSDLQTMATDAQVDIYAVHFLAPIMDNVRNVAKYGNVVPVKVQITSSCTGLPVTDAVLYVSTVTGSGGGIDEGTETVATSVSSADTGNVMRLADGFYIYNYSTKGLTIGTDYTIRIRVGSATGPIILSAVLQPKK
jgi:hypothetical protein